MKKVFNKLVRDNLSSVYDADIEAGISMTDYEVTTLAGAALGEALVQKLQEEAAEVVVAAPDPTKLTEEIADVLEVVDALMSHYGLSMEAVQEAKAAKRSLKGGFEKGVWLTSIEYID